MYRPSQQRQSSTSVTISRKTSTNTPQSSNQTQSINKLSSIHFTQYPSLQKIQKKGITTSLIYSSQNSTSQNIQQNSSFTPKPQQSVYEHYLKTLQNEISSRERQRLQLNRNLQDLKNQNELIFNELSQQKKKSVSLLKRLEQLQLFIKQSQDKKRSLNNEKQHIFKQYQVQVQRCKNLQGNEMKLRSIIQNIQTQLNSINKQNTNNISNINQLKSENYQYRNQLQRIEKQNKQNQVNNLNYKQQLSQISIQKNKIIQSIQRQKLYIQTQYNNVQRLNNDIKRQLRQKQDINKQINKKLIDMKQSYELQRDRLKYKINEIQFEKSAIKKQYQIQKQNIKKQIQLINNQNQRIKQIIVQYEKDKKIDFINNEQVTKQIQNIRRQLNILKKQKIKQQIKFKQQIKIKQQQLNKQLLSIQNKQMIINQKQKCNEYLSKRLHQLQTQYNNVHNKLSNQNHILINQINYYKIQLSKQSTQHQQQYKKLTNEKQQLQKYINDQIKRIKHQSNQQIKAQQELLNKQNQNKQIQLKQYYQNTIHILQLNISQLTNSINSIKHKHFSQIQSITKSNQQHINHQLQINQESYHQQYQLIQNQLKSQIAVKISNIKSLSQKNIWLESQLQTRNKQLYNSQQQFKLLQSKYHQQLNQLQNQYNINSNLFANQISTITNQLQSQKNTLLKQINTLSHELKHTKQHSHNLIQQINKLKSQKQSILNNLHQSQHSTANNIFELKNIIINLQQQKAQLQSIIKTKQHQSNRKIDQIHRQIKQKLDINIRQKKDVQNMLLNCFKSLSNVIDFSQKYSGENIRSKSKISINHITNNSIQLFDNCKHYCQQLTSFISQRLYVINILMQQNNQLKELQQKYKTQKNQIQQKLQLLINQNNILQQQKQQLSIQLQQILVKTQSSHKQNNQSISKLKEHVNLYKKQLSIYEIQIQQISNRFQEYQMKTFKYQAKISQLQEQIQSCKNEYDKLMKKHMIQLQVHKQQKLRHIQSLKQTHQNQKILVIRQAQEKLSQYEGNHGFYQQKLKQSQKIIDKKTQQYQELQRHFKLTTQRIKQQHLSQIQHYQRQIKYITNKSQSPSKDIWKKKIQLLQSDLLQKQKQLKVLEQNNALLRKNFISSINQQQNLREQIKITKSQRSQSRSKSKDGSKKDTQQLRNKYLLRKSSQQRSRKQLNQSVELNQSLGSRSYSNSQLNQKRFQSPRGSQTKFPTLNMTSITKNQRQIQTQRPVSNIQRSSPNVPLDLKRIRQRNNKYFQSQDSQQQPESISQQQTKPQIIKIEDEINNLISPIKRLQTKSSVLFKASQLPQNNQ